MKLYCGEALGLNGMVLAHISVLSDTRSVRIHTLMFCGNIHRDFRSNETRSYRLESFSLNIFTEIPRHIKLLFLLTVIIQFRLPQKGSIRPVVGLIASRHNDQRPIWIRPRGIPIGHLISMACIALYVFL